MVIYSFCLSTIIACAVALLLIFSLGKLENQLIKITPLATITTSHSATK